MARISVVLTNRTNYSKLKLVMAELAKQKGVHLHIVASSSSILERYGSSVNDLKSDGFRIDYEIDCLLMNDSHEAMAQTAGLSLIHHANYFKQVNPDYLLIVGDRFDALPAALAASMMNIPIAHIQGGETSGTIDNKVRDLISKIATLHFVATEHCVDRLARWGIEKSQIFNFGCPAAEYISKLEVGASFDPSRLKRQYKRTIDIKPGEPYFLVMVHPDTTNDQDIDMTVVLAAVEKFEKKALVFYPNTDPNNSNIVSGIARFNQNPRFYMIRHMPLEGFVHTMAHAACMIGNSSAGIREAASFGTPVVNIGSRQDGRERNPNTRDVPCDFEKITDAISESIAASRQANNIYFQDHCSSAIANEIYSKINPADHSRSARG